MDRYLATFRRHKIAVVLPLVIAIVVTTLYAASRPAQYETSTTVWFDTPLPAASSLDNPQSTTPAQEGQQVLEELLGTQQFLVKVGKRGPLAAYLTSHPGKQKTGLTTDLESRVDKSTTGSPSLDDRITSTLHKAFSSDPIGPQVLVVSMTSTNPSIIVGTLNALTAEYGAEVASDRAQRDQATASYYNVQLQGASASLARANEAVTTYQQEHPTAVPALDPIYAQLIQSATQAQTTYAGIQDQFQSSNLALNDVQSPATFRVLDPAQLVSRLSNKKHEIFTVVAGFVAGLLISALVISAFTALDKTARRDKDVEEVLGMEVVTSIRQLPRRRILPPARRERSS
ncbi:MAG: hypothetical protein ACRDYY_12825 [Acidimicrobiales bacterium]